MPPTSLKTAGPPNGFQPFTTIPIAMPFPDPTPPLTLQDYAVRRAIRADVPGIVALLLEDPVSAAREPPPSQLDQYYAAFADIDSDPRQFLAVVTSSSTSTTSSSSSSASGEVVGCAQLTLIPGLTRGGALRVQVEGVHVANHLQGHGLGSALFAWVDEMGRAAGAGFAQLTSDKKRPEAHRFYGRLGWVASHEGFKKSL